jgi:hypothetical protein
MGLFGLPSATSLLEPVTCVPSWIAHYAAIPNTVIASGCGTSGGNVQCDPKAMAAAAGKKIGRDVSLEAYTLARYITSEVGTRSVAERVAVAQNAINRVKYVEKLGSINSLLLYRQSSGHPNRGFYGPIHSGDDLKAPYGRWAATSRDPALSNLIIAIDVLDGTIPRDFSKGADDQYGPEILIARNGLAATQNGVRSRGRDRKYWVGPLPGVDHLRTFQYRTMKDVSPDSELGRTLIERGVQAMASGRPDWSHLPVCSGVGPLKAIALGTTAAVVLGVGFTLSRILSRRFVGV